jgi:hypothetical protein
MLSVLRRAVAVAAVAAASAGAVEAQFGSLSMEEIRLDVAGVSVVDGTSTLMVGGPGTVAVGIYLNDRIALEPSLSFTNISADNFPAFSVTQFGLFVPFYLKGDRGHNGLFISPGLTIAKVTDEDAAMDVGADIGFKKAMSDKVSWRAAAVIRTGDSTADEMLIGGTFGFSIFWR